MLGLSETFSKNYKIIRDYVKHHASTPVNTNVDPTITDQSYNPDYIVKSIKQQQKTLTEYEVQSIKMIRTTDEETPPDFDDSAIGRRKR